MGERPALVLFRNDLRVFDNGALSAAASTGKPVVAAFILDEASDGVRPRGSASKWWLHHSLIDLTNSLGALGVRLTLRRGKTRDAVEQLIKESEADAVFWNRNYDPAVASADAQIKAELRRRGLKAESFAGELLHEPSKLRTKGGSYYRVFTPFRKALTSDAEPRDPIDRPERMTSNGDDLESVPLNELLPLPTSPDWASEWTSMWTPGENGARTRLDQFLAGGIEGYSIGRDFPARPSTSTLSPHLAHGEITPYSVFARLRSSKSLDDSSKFKAEMAWREFCHHLRFHNPYLGSRNFQKSFDAFPWINGEKNLHVWQQGRTGYPIVDAGMRELWHTGTMHNRVRMIVASFLTKHLLIDWREGERWFWDTLLDADPASNPANWQWVAGCGADAAPYFRVFNPVLQGEKFDAQGIYVRRHIPELKDMPDRFLHRPWEASEHVLDAAGVKLGKTYPAPIVDHAQAREWALGAYRSIRGRA